MYSIEGVENKNPAEKYIIRYEDGTEEEITNGLIMEIMESTNESMIEFKTVGLNYEDIKDVVVQLLYVLFDADSEEDS